MLGKEEAHLGKSSTTYFIVDIHCRQCLKSVATSVSVVAPTKKGNCRVKIVYTYTNLIH